MMNLKYNSPVVLKERIDDSYNFKPLPTPSGAYPYRLDIKQILGDKTKNIQDQMVFHMVGDTGSARHSDFQALVASTMAEQLSTQDGAIPSFLYHLGDIVYNHGEAHEYPSQFLKPYACYEAPIFAIPGNHDGDINPETSAPYESLDAFVDVFCDSHSRSINFGGAISRRSMIQPNIYWTLETPLARFIGLYANVTKHGTITDTQREWFIEELRYAREKRGEQALIVCIHHAPYSADTNHGSSLDMIELLENAFIVAGIRPDAVFSGHVHNYQRFEKKYEDGTSIPYIVAGAGGYADLHTIASIDNPTVEPLETDSNRVRLEAYCDNCYGFLKLEIEKTAIGLKLTGKYYTLSNNQGKAEATLYDRFEIPLKRSTFMAID